MLPNILAKSSNFSFCVDLLIFCSLLVTMSDKAGPRHKRVKNVRSLI